MAVQYLRIQVRRDSKVNWSAANPVLLLGEVGYETDTKRSKTGDGGQSWKNLPYDKAGIVTVGEGLTVDEDGVLTNTYDHSEDLGPIGEQTVKQYVDTQDAATLQSANTYADGAVDVEKAQRMTEDAAIRDDITVEQTARENKDNNLQGQINANLVEFQTYSAATGTRLAFLETDHVTGTEVDAVQATALQAVADEETRALAAEAAIQADVDANETASDAADTALSGRLGTLESGSSVAGSVAEAKKAGDDAAADAAAAQTTADQGVTDAATNAGRLDVLENADAATVGSVAEAKKAGDDAQTTADANAAAVSDLTDGTTTAGKATVISSSNRSDTLTQPGVDGEIAYDANRGAVVLYVGAISDWVAIG